MPLIEFLSFIRSVVMDYISFTIIIKEKRRINAIKVQFDRITPSFMRIFGFNYDVTHPTRKLSGNHIKGVIVLIVTNYRSINTHANSRIVHLKLLLTIQHMSNLSPVH